MGAEPPLPQRPDAPNDSAEPQSVEPRVSAQEMPVENHRTVHAQAQQDEAQDRVGEAEEGRAGAVGNEADDGDERGEPGCQACAYINNPHPAALKPKTE